MIEGQVSQPKAERTIWSGPVRAHVTSRNKPRRLSVNHSVIAEIHSASGSMAAGGLRAEGLAAAKAKTVAASASATPQRHALGGAEGLASGTAVRSALVMAVRWAFAPAPRAADRR